MIVYLIVKPIQILIFRVGRQTKVDQPFHRVMMTKFSDKADLAYDYAAYGFELHIDIAWTAIFIFLSYRLLKASDL